MKTFKDAGWKVNLRVFLLAPAQYNTNEHTTGVHKDSRFGSRMP